MNFEDEHYVRIYTRDTKTVKRWGWQGRVVFWELMRKVDKAGLLDEIEDLVSDVALMTELPEEVVAAGLPKLIQSGAVELRGCHLIVPNYIQAQTVAKSDRIRAQESRARRAAKARAESVTDCDARHTERTSCDEPERESPERDNFAGVTVRDEVVTERDDGERKRDEPSQPVTVGHSTQYNAVQRKNSTTKGAAHLTALEGSLDTPSECPPDFTLPEPALAQLADEHKVTRETIDRCLVEFRTYWTEGEGRGQLRKLWPKRFREHLRRQASDGFLQSPPKQPKQRRAPKSGPIQRNSSLSTDELLAQWGHGT